MDPEAPQQWEVDINLHQNAGSLSKLYSQILGLRFFVSPIGDQVNAAYVHHGTPKIAGWLSNVPVELGKDEFP